MCTAVSYKAKNHYFGRNLDLHFVFGEEVTVTPRNYPLRFRKMGELKSHYAMIGMALVEGGYPLYFDATNEKGLSMAGLNFYGNAHYKPYEEGKENIAPFEFIPWILGQCSDVEEVRALLRRINLIRCDFSQELSLTPLHWMISDREKSITVESVKEGLKIYENPVGVLTNNPTFDYHMLYLSNFINLSAEAPINRFSDKIKLKTYSRGMGAVGLPGDLSSTSRFVKAAFTKLNSLPGASDAMGISQFFHILKSVEQQRGCVHLGNGKYEMTIYSSCCNTDRGVYYYTTYENSQISGVDMYKENLDGQELIQYPLINTQQIYLQN